MAESYLLAGGGTAGHINPLLATATELRARGARVEVLGASVGLEQDLVPRAGFTLHEVPKVPMPRRPSMDLLRLPGRLRAAVRAARAAIDASGADAVVGFGGYVSAPAYLAARRAGIPVVVHEANARPGIANRFGARRAAAVAATFDDTPLPRAVVTGLPLREEIRTLAATLADGPTAETARAEARERLGWSADAPVLLVTGGSLGAASVNAAVVGAVPELVARGVHVLHLTGRGKAEEAEGVRASVNKDARHRYLVEEYRHDMATAFAAADAVVCRSGAATVCEISALGLPALYVPLPHGNGEQADNARGAVEAGAAELIEDAQFSAAALVAMVERILLDGSHARAMREAAAEIGIADGAARLADLIESVA